MKVEKKFSLSNKEEKVLHLYFKATGKVEISASEKEGGKWIEAYHRIYKVVDGIKDDSQLTSFASRKKTTGKDQIPVGKYIVHSEYNEFKRIHLLRSRQEKRQKSKSLWAKQAK